MTKQMLLIKGTGARVQELNEKFTRE